MNEYIEVGQPLQFTDPNTPTRVGEIVENVSDIYNIPSPRLGMQVFVKSEKKSFVITSLKSKVIGGVDVPEAAVEAFELVGAKSITWNNDTDPSNMNDFVVAGVYDIKGERTRIDDNLPILNTGGGHTFNARLTVLDSSIPGNGKNDDKCITQVMSFNNRLGQGEVYIRTGKGASLDNLTWENWSTLQRNVNVGHVYTLDDLIDNGIYSGVYVGTGSKFTFVMVVINDYALAAKLGADRVVNQFLYAVEVGGVVRYITRKKIGGAPWNSEEILNKDEITSMISAEIKKVNDRISTLIDGAPETLDTLIEIATWIDEHGKDAAAMLLEIQQNTVKINAEISRAQAKEKELHEAIGLNLDDINNEVERATQAENDIKTKATHYNTLHFSSSADHVTLGGKSIDGNNTIGQDIPAATTEKAGVMTAKDKKEQVKMTPLVNGDIIVGQAREIHSRNGKTVTDSFLVRTTAGSGTIGDGVATLKSVGGNIVKNLVGDFVDKNAGRIDLKEIGRYYFLTTKNADAAGSVTLRLAINPTVVGHKYYFGMQAKSSKPLSAFLNKYDANDYLVIRQNVTEYAYLSNIVTETVARESLLLYLWGYNGTVDVGEQAAFSQPLLVDITEMFGAGNEPTKEECDRMFGTMGALPQGLTIAKPTEFKSTGFNQFNPDNVLEGKAVVDNAIVDGDKKIAIIPCLPCKVGTGENNGYCIHGDFGEDIKVYLTPLNPLEVEGELYMHELTKDVNTDTYVPLIKGYLLVEVPTIANLCAHFLWSEDCDREAYEPYYESVVELPTIPQMSEWGLAGIKTSGTLVADTIDLENMVYTKRLTKLKLNNISWTYYPSSNEYPYGFFAGSIAGIKFSNSKNIFPSTKYTLGTNFKTDKIVFGNAANAGRTIYIIDSEYKDREALNANLADVDFYVEIAPQEYPIVTKVDNNYISSDYGVEQFDSVVPCNANNLYYMRSLAGEARNFLDRLMAGLGTSDVTVVADRIIAVVSPAVEPANVEPETPIEI